MFITFWLFHAKTIKDHVELTTKAVEMTTINAATARTAARTTTTTTGQSQGAGKEVTIELTKLREFKRNQLEKEVEQGQRQLEELQTEEKKSVLRDNGWSDEVLLQRALINLHDKLQIIRYVEMPLPTGFDDVIEKLDTMNFGEDKNGFTTVTIHDSDKIDPLLSKPELTQLVTALKPAYDQASVLRDQQVLREREQERDWYQ
jgi:FtsZ-binding cell division protein ZapB